MLIRSLTCIKSITAIHQTVERSSEAEGLTAIDIYVPWGAKSPHILMRARVQ